MRFPRVELSEPELLDRIEAGYGPARRQALRQELAHLRQESDGPDQTQRLLQPYRNRMFDQTSAPRRALNRARGKPQITRIPQMIAGEG